MATNWKWIGRIKIGAVRENLMIERGSSTCLNAKHRAFVDVRC
jgi:hypothetical protein